MGNTQLTGCSNPSAKNGSIAAVTLTTSGAGANNCSGSLPRLPKRKITATISWGPGVKASKVTFATGSVSASPPGLVLSNGKVSGSFAGHGATANAYLSASSVIAGTACYDGIPGASVSSLTVDSSLGSSNGVV